MRSKKPSKKDWENDITETELEVLNKLDIGLLPKEIAKANTIRTSERTIQRHVSKLKKCGYVIQKRIGMIYDYKLTKKGKKLLSISQNEMTLNDMSCHSLKLYYPYSQKMDMKFFEKFTNRAWGKNILKRLNSGTRKTPHYKREKKLEGATVLFMKQGCEVNVDEILAKNETELKTKMGKKIILIKELLEYNYPRLLLGDHSERNKGDGNPDALIDQIHIALRDHPLAVVYFQMGGEHYRGEAVVFDKSTGRPEIEFERTQCAVEDVMRLAEFADDLVTGKFDYKREMLKLTDLESKVQPLMDVCLGLGRKLRHLNIDTEQTKLELSNQKKIIDSMLKSIKLQITSIPKFARRFKEERRFYKDLIVKLEKQTAESLDAMKKINEDTMELHKDIRPQREEYGASIWNKKNQFDNLT